MNAEVLTRAMCGAQGAEGADGGGRTDTGEAEDGSGAESTGGTAREEAGAAQAGVAGVSSRDGRKEILLLAQSINGL